MKLPRHADFEVEHGDHETTIRYGGKEAKGSTFDQAASKWYAIYAHRGEPSRPGSNHGDYGGDTKALNPEAIVGNGS